MTDQRALSETGENVLPGSNPGDGTNRHDGGASLEPVSLSARLCNTDVAPGTTLHGRRTPAADAA